MSKEGLAGLEQAGNDVLALAATLTDEQWRTPSGAEGWSVQDVVSHMGNLLGLLMTAVNGKLLPTHPPIGIEDHNEVQIAAERDWSPERSVGTFRDQLAKAIPTFAPLQDEPTASVEAQLLDLGSYPLHAIVDMFTFDLNTHIRFDILAPRGPINSDVLPPLGEPQLGPAVSWLLGGVQQMQPELPGALTGPIRLKLTGPAATSVVIDSSDGRTTVTPTAAYMNDASASVTSTTTDFLAWSTTRVPWRELVAVDGDQQVAERFLDALNLT